MNLSLSERSVFVERNGARYHVRVSGQGRPVMLLHGFTGSGESWIRVANYLAQSHTVIRPDLLGHGRTSSPPEAYRYGMPQASADLVAILDTFSIERAALHGYSMGGRLALYTAFRFPDRIAHLSLESASPGLESPAERDSRRTSDEMLADRILSEGVEAFVNEWERLPLFESQTRLPPSVLTLQRAQRLANNKLGLANSLRGMGTGVQPDLWNYLDAMTMPTLLLTGALDRKFTEIAAQMAGRLPNATRVTVPDCGHAVHLEQPSAWRMTVKRFFET